MEKQYTPGPWKLTEILIGNYNPDSESPDNRPVSHCVVAEYDENLLITYALPNTSAGDDLMANAHLIAAAPELLEACKKIYDYSAKQFEANSDERALWAQINKIARAAIAKATGKEG